LLAWSISASTDTMKALVLAIKAAALFLAAFAVFGLVTFGLQIRRRVASGSYEAFADGQETTHSLRPDHIFHQTVVVSCKVSVAASAGSSCRRLAQLHELSDSKRQTCVRASGLSLSRMHLAPPP